jgi:hypothetical protein
MVLKWIVSKNRDLYEDENLVREYSNLTAIDAALYAYAYDLATCSTEPGRINAAALGKMALFILCIL